MVEETGDNHRHDSWYSETQLVYLLNDYRREQS
jgi:hypothetical protein